MMIYRFRRFFFPILFLVWIINCSGQNLIGFSTKWDDSFTEWYLYADDEAYDGELTMRWLSQGDWSEWDYRLGEISGQIRVKWKGDPNLWELRGDNEIITIRTIFKDDFRKWEVNDGTHRIDVQSRWSNIFEEWIASSSRWGEYKMFTEYQSDLRDWILEDNLLPEISIHMKIAITFVPILFTVPKF